ncbi:hypothetical protein BC834DRAFT_909622, partial [Gloeopeniophorella convolvens]
ERRSPGWAFGAPTGESSGGSRSGDRGKRARSGEICCQTWNGGGMAGCESCCRYRYCDSHLSFSAIPNVNF